MLAALVQWSPEGMLEGQMRSHAGMKNSGTYRNYLSDLRTAGHIETRGNLMFATQSGLDYFGGNIPASPSSTEEVLAIWKPKLREGAKRILDVLVSKGGNDVALGRIPGHLVGGSKLEAAGVLKGLRSQDEPNLRTGDQVGNFQ